MCPSCVNATSIVYSSVLEVISTSDFMTFRATLSKLEAQEAQEEKESWVLIMSGLRMSDPFHPKPKPKRPKTVGKREYFIIDLLPLSLIEHPYCVW